MRHACFAFNHLDELPTQLIAFASIRALNDRLNSAFGETVSENALLGNLYERKTRWHDKEA